MKTILVTGASGMIGRALVHRLEERNYRVLKLSRNPSDKPDWFQWNVQTAYLDTQALKQADFIIHLAGTGIADKRWSSRQKKRILDSRVLSTNLLYHKCLESGLKPEAFIALSGTGYYGLKSTDTPKHEDAAPGTDFLARVCKRWESASMLFASLPVRTVIFRSGVVLSAKGGALERMAKPVRLGLGAALGNGSQWLPWVHIDDLCAMLLMAIEDPSFEGIYNAVAPQHVTNKDFTGVMAEVLDKRLRLPGIPEWVLNLTLGEMAVLLTKGVPVASGKLESTGFKYRFPELKPALEELLTSN
jgi:uncharacterized protein (TIGR01777 family)